MRVAVTGASGFIGARLAVQARRRGYDVVAMGRVNNPVEADRAQDLEAAGVTLRDLDIGDEGGLASALEGVEQVFHLAAAQHEANVDDEYFRRINVDGTRHMLHAALEAGVQRFVHGSTIGVYGDALEGELSESSPVRPDNVYGVTKLEGERVALAFNEKMPVTAIRISETYGPGDNRLLKLFRAIRKRRFFMIGSGENLRQLIFVDDLVDGLFEAADSDNSPGEVFVMAGSEVLTTRSTVDTIAAALDVPSRYARLPMWPFLVTAVLMEKGMRPLGLQPPLHRRRLDFFRKSFYFSIEKARTALAFEPTTTFAEGARITADWYKEKGLI